MSLSEAKKIENCPDERELTLTDLAKMLNKSPSTLSGKMTRDNFTEKDLKHIADLLDYDYEAVFTDRKSGRKV